MVKNTNHPKLVYQPVAVLYGNWLNRILGDRLYSGLIGVTDDEFKNNNEEYLKIRRAAKQAVRGTLSDSRQLLKFALYP